MLEESEVLFKNLKKDVQEHQIKKAKKKIFFKTLKKRAIRIFIVLLISIFVFFPKQTGYVLGNWINDFIGTVIKESHIKEWI